MKTRRQIDELIASWRDDRGWDIEDHLADWRGDLHRRRDDRHRQRALGG